jgi:hypothetical protein
MSDIVERLRAWVYTDSQYATAREAADEIERLRGQLSGSGNQVETRQPVLTDEERDVLAAIEADASYRAMKRTERVVRRLLDRLG